MTIFQFTEFARNDDRGTAAIEFAAVSSFLLILLVGVTDVGRLALASMRVRYAAEAGATYAASNGANLDFSKIQQAAAAATSMNCGAANSTNRNACSSTLDAYYGCASATGISKVGSYPNSNKPNCMTSSGSTVPAGLYVTVTSSVAFAPFFKATPISYPSSVSHLLQVRVQ